MMFFSILFSFTLQDLQTVEKLATYVAPLLTHCCKAEEEQKMRKQSQVR